MKNLEELKNTKKNDITQKNKKRLKFKKKNLIKKILTKKLNQTFTVEKKV